MIHERQLFNGIPISYFRFRFMLLSCSLHCKDGTVADRQYQVDGLDSRIDWLKSVGTVFLGYLSGALASNHFSKYFASRSSPIGDIPNHMEIAFRQRHQNWLLPCV